MFSITLQDTDDKKLNIAINDIKNILKGFLRRFSYLSSLSYEDSDKYEYYLNMYPLYDIIKCGNQVIITL